MTSDLVQVANFATENEAAHVRSILEEHGIEAFVDGAAANTVLSYVGSALGGVRLLTSLANAEAACEFLTSLTSEPAAAKGPWYCAECEDIVEAGFDVCWSCGKERQLVEGEYPDSGVAEPQRTEVDSREPEALVTTRRDLSNPYVAPSVVDAQPPGVAKVSAKAGAEEMVHRAYRGAWIGFVVLPVVTHAYSMYLLIRAAAHQENLTPVTEKLWYRAFAINSIACFVWITIITIFMRG